MSGPGNPAPSGPATSNPAPGATELNAGNSSRASHVWRLELPAGPQVYRRSWWVAPEVSAFMLGLGHLFGVDPRDLDATAGAYRFWVGLKVWAVPAVLGYGEFQGGAVLRLEFVPGEGGSFANVDARELGRRVARTHTRRAEWFGDVSGRTRQPVGEFYSRALQVIRTVAPKYKPANWHPYWAEVERIFAATPAPSSAVPTLLDWNETQFVWHGGFPYAPVDVEASAFAPPELDLCFWEVLLDAAPGGPLSDRVRCNLPFPGPHPGPRRVPPHPAGAGIGGSPPLPEWLARPAHFSSGG